MKNPILQPMMIVGVLTLSSMPALADEVASHVAITSPKNGESVGPNSPCILSWEKA